jgi:hypothetical protein
VGTNGENHRVTFTAGSTPNDCCPRKRHLWGTRQSRWLPKGRRLCCLSVPKLFVCQKNRPTAESISRTLGACACVSDTPHTRHSNICNSGNPPIFATEHSCGSDASVMAPLDSFSQVGQRESEDLFGIHQLTLTRSPIDRIFKLVTAGPRTTTRDECGYRENAQTIRVRSEPHRTARTDFVKFVAPSPPTSLIAVTGAALPIKRPWREKDSSSATASQN